MDMIKIGKCPSPNCGKPVAMEDADQDEMVMCMSCAEAHHVDDILDIKDVLKIKHQVTAGQLINLLSTIKEDTPVFIEGGIGAGIPKGLEGFNNYYILTRFQL